MEAKLGVTTCDTCQKPMEKGQPVLILVEGNITEANDMLILIKDPLKEEGLK